MFLGNRVDVDLSLSDSDDNDLTLLSQDSHVRHSGARRHVRSVISTDKSRSPKQNMLSHALRSGPRQYTRSGTATDKSRSSKNNMSSSDFDDDDSSDAEAAPALKVVQRELVYPDFKGSTTCRLLKLPAELRNVIYEMALSQDSGEVVINLNDSPERATINPFALTETCKKVRKDCGDMVYHFNTFTFQTQLLAGGELSTSWNFNSILAKQMKTMKLKVVKIHLGCGGCGSARDAWGPIQTPVRKLRKCVATLQVAFDASEAVARNALCGDGQAAKRYGCVFSTVSAQDAVSDLRDCWLSIPEDDRNPFASVNSFSYIVRSLFPFWPGTTIL